ncbi:HAMP domain-containing protein [Diaphorobacter sp. HDW4A]|uniref:sensor histidine kinase n=1 Tax=Diaphorobacter sp. HDW4A TaxID=2714924 RepID=UPI00140B3503|nr:ATP-binding protein [Diaphorobacter sp. HDW4A]QIL82654.1 HAMP domain-containing protein [Diaphorobacter sp. HDW4A]
MARGLNRIWVRFGLWIAATVLSTIALLSACAWTFSSVQYYKFYNHLPDAVRVELDELNARDLEDSPRAMQIYGQYWRGDMFFGEQMSLIIGLIVCLPFGLTVGFWVSRYVTRPLASIVEVAKRVELGDFSARAVSSGAHGEMGEVIHTFNNMIDSLDELEAERRATAASISHELRTPITVLKARLHAVCDGIIVADEAELRTLLAQTEHLSRLVEDLHTLSVADAGQLSLQKQLLCLNIVVSETLSALLPQLQAADMELKLTLPSNEAESDIRADADRMRQIVTNLVSNAIRYAASGHWLDVLVQLKEDEDGVEWVQLTISDAGPGLPQELQSHPFQRFAIAPGKRRREGSGLGLSIVRALTESQGGTVQTSTSARGGTSFVLRFAHA